MSVKPATGRGLGSARALSRASRWISSPNRVTWSASPTSAMIKCKMETRGLAAMASDRARKAAVSGTPETGSSSQTFDLPKDCHGQRASDLHDALESVLRLSRKRRGTGERCFGFTFNPREARQVYPRRPADPGAALLRVPRPGREAAEGQAAARSQGECPCRARRGTPVRAGISGRERGAAADQRGGFHRADASGWQGQAAELRADQAAGAMG